MPANPDLNSTDANALVTYILSLRNEAKPSLPAKGSVDATLGKTPSPNGAFIISATYTDKGGENIKPLTGANSTILTSNSFDLAQAGEFETYTKMVFDGRHLLMVPATSGSFGLPAIDLSGIGSITLMTASQEPINTPVNFEIRLDSPTGEVVAQGVHTPGEGFKAPNMPILMHQANIPVTGTTDGKKHKLYFVSNANGAELGTFIIMGITFNAK
jgi:hypothetical protein